MVSSTLYEFSFDFPLFYYMFLSSICCDMWLYHHTTVNLFNIFCVSDLDDKVVLIRQRSHIKPLFVNSLILESYVF